MIRLQFRGKDSLLSFKYEELSTTAEIHDEVEYRKREKDTEPAPLVSATVVRYFKDEDNNEARKKAALRKLCLQLPRIERNGVWAAYWSRSPRYYNELLHAYNITGPRDFIVRTKHAYESITSYRKSILGRLTFSAADMGKLRGASWKDLPWSLRLKFFRTVLFDPDRAYHTAFSIGFNAAARQVFNTPLPELIEAPKETKCKIRAEKA